MLFFFYHENALAYCILYDLNVWMKLSLPVVSIVRPLSFQLLPFSQIYFPRNTLKQVQKQPNVDHNKREQ